MLRSRSKLPIVFAVFLVTLFTTAAVRANDADNKGDVSSTLDVLTPVTVGGKSLAPGTYTVKANDTKVIFVMRGKTVAEASVQWKDAPQKSPSTSLLADQGAVKEIHFSGKTRYVTIAQ